MSPIQDPISTAGDERDLVDLLHSRGQRVTSQRLVILRELRRRRQHATAEEVHRAVQHELPGVSVPTIYATLDLFVELGLARRIDTASAALYDAGLEPHQHAVCRRCGRVQDVDGGLDAEAFIGAARESGFQPQGAELIITGLCAECAARASG
ncbi:MAG TPA: Fur family transcriptional regulator [Solirubrobacteraceae bacterium]|nr:Fur family transcriptional regulator [Solirubrobacteraceae bacterium]